MVAEEQGEEYHIYIYLEREKERGERERAVRGQLWQLRVKENRLYDWDSPKVSWVYKASGLLSSTAIYLYIYVHISIYRFLDLNFFLCLFVSYVVDFNVCVFYVGVR